MGEGIDSGRNIAARQGLARKTGKARSPKKKRMNPARLLSISFLPSLFTMFSLFLGFQALLHIVKATRSDFLQAITLITLCVVLDGFDGTIARLTKTESNFGVQLDSLNDGVTFGLTIAAMIFFWGFKNHYIQLGAIIAFVFLSAGLIRLARFNVFKEAHLYPANVFIGLPIPVAALSICSWVLLFNVESPGSRLHALLFAGYAVIISVLMITNIQYRTVKNINVRSHLPILLLLAIVVGFVIIYPLYTLPVITTSYILSPFFFRYKYRRRKAEGARSHPIPETDSATAKPTSGMER